MYTHDSRWVWKPEFVFYIFFPWWRCRLRLSHEDNPGWLIRADYTTLYRKPIHKFVWINHFNGFVLVSLTCIWFKQDLLSVQVPYITLCNSPCGISKNDFQSGMAGMACERHWLAPSGYVVLYGFVFPSLEYFPKTLEVNRWLATKYHPW